MSSLYPESWQIPPMKYCSKASDKAARQAFESGDFIMQEKYDGALYQLEKTDSGYIYLFSRTKSRKTGELVEKSDNFPHIKKWAEWAIPNGTILVGEIYVEGGHSNDVTKLSGCLPQNAVKRQFDSNEYGGPVKYKVFDIIRFAGEDIQNKSTIERINYLNNTSLDYSFSDKYVQRVTTYYDNFEERLQQIFKNGGEGAVFKNKNCPYRAGKRSTVSQAFKWKQHLDSIDLICTELIDPEDYYTGKEIESWPYWMEHSKTINRENLWYPIYGLFYEKYKKRPHVYKPVTKPAYFGWKNAMALGCFNKKGAIVYVGKVASGLTDNIREDMAKNPSNYLGKVIQISCMSIDSKEGTIRHPVFEAVRDDKNPEECIYEEIFNVK